MTETVLQIQALECHPACLMQPDMGAANYAVLRESIRAGYQEDKPIALYEGQILDGRHRYKACQEEGVKPLFFYVPPSVDPYRYVYEVHKGRRSYVSQEQQALVDLSTLEASDAWQAERQALRDGANARRAEAAKDRPLPNPAGVNQYTEKSLEVPQCEAQLTTPADKPESTPQHTHKPKKQPKPKKLAAIKAERIGVSRAAVERAEQIKRFDEENGSDYAEQVKNDKIAATAAIREIRKATVVQQLESVAAREIEQPTGKFDVIVIDPPWAMEKIERNERPNQVVFDYPTMSEAELAELEIPAADDCHVWLWTTHKFMPMAFRLLDAWGLRYVCAFVWHKPGGFQPIGLPQYNCEFALYARKGSPKFLDTKAFSTAFSAPRGAHSEKPEEFYELLRRVTGGRRLDMFNRRSIEGFSGWGKEAAA